MVDWLVPIGWIAGFLFTSRYTWWWLLDGFIHQKPDDMDEYVITGLSMFLTFLAWPLFMVGIFVRRFCQLLARTPIAKVVKWFYAEDREERKRILNGE